MDIRWEGISGINILDVLDEVDKLKIYSAWKRTSCKKG